jgi:hypothetical protein
LLVCGNGGSPYAAVRAHQLSNLVNPETAGKSASIAAFAFAE